MQAGDIPNLTKTYNLDTDAIASEFADFCEAYSCLNMPEECVEMRLNEERIGDPAQNSDSDEERIASEHEVNAHGEDDDIDDSIKMTQTMNRYLNPLKACYQLFGYPVSLETILDSCYSSSY